jgi:Ala-tRNA(Pro) deacylase
MALSSLREYLDRHNARYLVISHSAAFTAQGIAALAHISGKELAKTVMVKLNDRLVMAVLPAAFHLDLELLKRASGTQVAEIAAEEDFRELFPECETGAMPPFGHLYGIELLVEESLSKHREITFNACSHRELIRLDWKDFQKLARPKLMRFAAAKSAEAA